VLETASLQNVQRSIARFLLSAFVLMVVERVLLLITEQSSSFAYFNSSRLPVCGNLLALNVKIMDEEQRKHKCFLILLKKREN
jgi:hypothetical protein